MPAPRSRIGIVSDTHGLLRPEAGAWLMGCDRIVHGGDIGGPAILGDPWRAGFKLPVALGESWIEGPSAHATIVELKC